MKYIIILLFSLSLMSCEFLDMVPENDIETIETIFEKREDAERWLKTCHTFLQETTGSVVYYPSFMGADELVAGDFLRRDVANEPSNPMAGFFIGDGLQMTQNPYSELWHKEKHFAALRYCNIFIENIGRVYNMPDSEKELWIAEIKALKAHFYYELMHFYGAIILVPKNIETSSDVANMQQARSPFDECVKAVVTLLDEAMEILPPLKSKDISRWAYHSLESAATLKAKVLVLAASPQFNGNPAYAGEKNKNGVSLYSKNKDDEKWKLAAEAADEAIRICEQGDKQLISGSTGSPSALLGVMKDIEKSVFAPLFENKEAIFMICMPNSQTVTYATHTLPYVDPTKFNSQYNSNFKGCVSPSMKMVEMYYTERGLPIEADKQWDYSSRYKLAKENDAKYKGVVSLDEQVLNLHLRREPRFYANIAADRCFWQRGKSLTADNLLVLPYRDERFGTSSSTINSSIPQNLTGYWLKKGTYSDVSGKDYNAVFSRGDANILFRLAELYLIKAEAWNEYEGPSKDRVYAPLNKIRERAGIEDVETSWISYSKTPEKIDSKEGMREIIHQEWNIEFAFEGQRFWNLRRWLTAHIELNDKQYGWNIVGTNAKQFYNNFEGPVVVWSKRKFQSPRDYLFPIRSEEIMISGVKQNIGW